MPTPITIGGASAKSYGLTSRSGPAIYVEDVFSTYFYTGNGGTNAIANGVDLSTYGGLIWLKNRLESASDSSTGYHYIVDTARGGNKQLLANLTTASNTTSPSIVSAFNTNGFTLSTGSGLQNVSGNSYVSWTFRKQPKFFDIVTYTGNGSNRTIAHNLGSAPGCIIVKCTSTTGSWAVYHRSLTSAAYRLVLESANAEASSPTTWNSTAPTATEFSVGTGSTTNSNGETYIAYLFAHDAGGFGLSGTDNVISCGSFTTDGSGNGSVTLGWEPQFILVKPRGSVMDWSIADIMRGASQTGVSVIAPNTAAAENNSTGAPYLCPTATGFSTTSYWSSQTLIYIAIRRGPMKVPTDATKVFKPVARTGTGAAATVTGVGFPPDLVAIKNRQDYGNRWTDRLRGYGWALQPDATSAEVDNTTIGVTALGTDSFGLGSGNPYNANAGSETYANWIFRRAPGFFDVVCWTGASSGSQTISHNLGVVPELIINKPRSWAGGWYTYSALGGVNAFFRLDLTNAQASFSNMWPAAPTSSTFTVDVNNVACATRSAVSFLFATCPGVSKVGSYTGTGTTKQIDCGFTGGARFVMIKRADSTGDWYVWDTARGIIAANDPYLLLNSSVAEVTNTDYIDPYSAGFEISSTAPAAINANGGTFIYLAIA